MAKRGTGGGKKRGAQPTEEQLRNLPSEDEVREYFDRIHELHDSMESNNAALRGDINEVYDEASEGLDCPKEIIKFMFDRERKERKADKRVRKMGTREKTAFEKMAAMFGEDSPMGQYAKEKAQLIEAESTT